MTQKRNMYYFLWKAEELGHPKYLSHRFCFRLLWCSIGLVVFSLLFCIVKRFYPEIKSDKYLIISAITTGLAVAIPILGLLFDRKTRQDKNIH